MIKECDDEKRTFNNKENSIYEMSSNESTSAGVESVELLRTIVEENWNCSKGEEDSGNIDRLTY